MNCQDVTVHQSRRNQPTDRLIDTLSGISLSQRASTEEWFRTTIFALITTTILHKLLKASLCCACGNAEVSHQQTKKIVNKETYSVVR